MLVNTRFGEEIHNVQRAPQAESCDPPPTNSPIFLFLSSIELATTCAADL